MRQPIAISALAAALCVAAASPAAAQRTTARTATPVRPVAEWERSAGPSAPVRHVAAFFVSSARADRTAPVALVIGDSAGTLVASAWIGSDDAREQRLTVSVQPTQLVLRARTADGPLAIVLTQDLDLGTAPKPIGRWTHGGTGGALVARAVATAQ